VKRVAVFGNAGGGKSTLARRLAEVTGLPLYVVDMMQFKPGGAKVPDDEFLPFVAAQEIGVHLHAIPSPI
jgi:adenylate kinase family enzyme